VIKSYEFTRIPGMFIGIDVAAGEEGTTTKTQRAQRERISL
jgi:hypothetical protein